MVTFTLGDRAATPKQVELAKKYIQDDSTCAHAVFLSARHILGPNVRAYETDTIRWSMRQRGLKISELNYDKLFAAITLTMTTAFFWDANTFENVVLCFNDEEVDVGILQDAHPIWLGWGTEEAFNVVQSFVDVEDCTLEAAVTGEPLDYILMCLQREGFLVAPTGLEWVQSELDKECAPHCDLKERVQQRWAEMDKTQLASAEYAEDEMGVQLARLAGCHLYYEARQALYTRQLSALLAP